MKECVVIYMVKIYVGRQLALRKNVSTHFEISEDTEEWLR